MAPSLQKPAQTVKGPLWPRKDNKGNEARSDFRASMLAAALPIDPTKVFSVILDYIKYFLGRHDNERKQLAQLLKDNMLVSWLKVRNDKVEKTETDPLAADKKLNKINSLRGRRSQRWMISAATSRVGLRDD